MRTKGKGGLACGGKCDNNDNNSYNNNDSDNTSLLLHHTPRHKRAFPLGWVMYGLRFLNIFFYYLEHTDHPPLGLGEGKRPNEAPPMV